MPTAVPDVAAVIRAEMTRQGVSVLELSRRTDIPRTTLAYQINNASLTVNNLLLIADALNVRVADLVGEAA